MIGSVIILLESVPRLLNPESVNTKGMILLAILGVIFNGLAAFRLSKGKSMNEKMIFWHIWEDILGWVAVLVGGIFIYYFNIPVLDSVISILFTLFIVFQVFKNLRKVFQIFMQGIPSGVDSKSIENVVGSIKGISSVHDIHIWSLDGTRNIMTIHVKLAEENIQVIDHPSLIKLKKEIKEKVEAFDIEHVTVEFESNAEDCEYNDC
jgi:cobalt-zinc-cadmium efflux system protein